MKRASVSFDQSHSADDEAKGKLRYQTLLEEFLQQQKEYVSRKKKLQAAKQKRELILAEVRFLRRKHKCLLRSHSPNKYKFVLHLSSMDKETNTLQKDDEAKGRDHVFEEDVRCTKKIKNHLIQDKGEGKQKICWPDQVTLNV